MAMPRPTRVTTLTAYVETSMTCASASVAPTPPSTAKTPTPRQSNAAIPVQNTITSRISASGSETASDLRRSLAR